MRTIRLCSMAILFLCSISTAPATMATNYVDSSGREWRLLTDTVGFSWNELATICGHDVEGAATPCFGTLTESANPGRTVDFTGWTWASLAEIDVLLDEFIDCLPGGVLDSCM